MTVVVFAVVDASVVAVGPASVVVDVDVEVADDVSVAASVVAFKVVVGVDVDVAVTQSPVDHARGSAAILSVPHEA